MYTMDIQASNNPRSRSIAKVEQTNNGDMHRHRMSAPPLPKHTQRYFYSLHTATACKEYQVQPLPSPGNPRT
ncbi:hypothetical protein M758_UG001700 [Ceratodon purpureus]|nr:hypothetical protein M758_UG001700 [Ceratodon purpureus]